MWLFQPNFNMEQQHQPINQQIIINTHAHQNGQIKFIELDLLVGLSAVGQRTNGRTNGWTEEIVSNLFFHFSVSPFLIDISIFVCVSFDFFKPVRLHLFVFDCVRVNAFFG